MTSMGPFLDMTQQAMTGSLGRSTDVVARRKAIRSSAGTPFPGNNPAPYQTVRFAQNIQLPGECKVTGKGFEQRMQRDQPAGSHGTHTKSVGIQPARFTIAIRMWMPEHWDALQRLIPLLKSQKQKVTTDAVGFTGNANGAGFSGVVPNTTTTKTVATGPAPLDVYHPVLALFKIRSVHILSVTLPQPGSEVDVWECAIECEEFVYRPSAVKTNDKSLEITEANLGPTAATLALSAPRPAEPPPSRAVVAEPPVKPYPTSSYRVLDKW